MLTAIFSFLGGQNIIHDFGHNHQECVIITQEDLQNRICNGKYEHYMGKLFAFLRCNYLLGITAKEKIRAIKYTKVYNLLDVFYRQEIKYPTCVIYRKNIFQHYNR